jgi:hypothetical protein
MVAKFFLEVGKPAKATVDGDVWRKAESTAWKAMDGRFHGREMLDNVRIRAFISPHLRLAYDSNLLFK